MEFATDLSQSILADITQQCKIMPVDLLQNISTMVSDDALIRSSIQSGNQEVCFFDNEMAAFKRKGYEGEITDLPDGVWTIVGKRTTFSNRNLPFSLKTNKNEGTEQLIMTSITFSSGNIQYTRRIIENNSNLNFEHLNIFSSRSGLSLIQKSNASPPLLVRTKTLEIIGEVQLHQVNIGNLLFSQPCFDHTNENCYFSAIDKTRLQLQLIEWNSSSGLTVIRDIKAIPSQISIEEDINPSAHPASFQAIQIQPNSTQRIFLTSNWVVVAVFPQIPSQPTLLFHIPKSTIAASDSYNQVATVGANIVEVQLKGQVVDVSIDYEDKGSNINYAFILHDPLNPYNKPVIQRYCFDPPNPRECQTVSESKVEAPLGTSACIVNVPVDISKSVFFSPGIWSPEYKNYPQNSCLFNNPANSFTYPSQTWISGLTQVPTNSNKNFVLLCCTYVGKDGNSNDSKKIFTELQIFDCGELAQGPAFVIKAAAPFDFGQLCTKGSWDSAI